MSSCGVDHPCPNGQHDPTPAATYRLSLTQFGRWATYRTHLPGDNPFHQYVMVTLDRDRFNALGKPGYIDVTIAIAEEERA
jgi:hypothetical protein